MNKAEIMNKVNRTINRAGLKIKKHSPEILVITGIAGFVTTSVLAYKAAPKVNEVLDNAKKTIVSSIKMSEDTLGGIINNYLFNELDDLPLYDERIKEFNKVTREDIIEVAKKVKLNTIYLLAGEEK